MLNHSNRTNTNFVCILQTDAESRMLIQCLYNVLIEHKLLLRHSVLKLKKFTHNGTMEFSKLSTPTY
jgi:hypothetical protein